MMIKFKNPRSNRITLTCYTHDNVYEWALGYTPTRSLYRPGGVHVPRLYQLGIPTVLTSGAGCRRASIIVTNIAITTVRRSVVITMLLPFSVTITILK